MSGIDDPVARGLAAAEIFAESRSPTDLVEEMRLECEQRGTSVTLIERRAPWGPGASEWTRTKIAQLRFDRDAGSWSLYFPDRDGRWWPSEGSPWSRSVDPLLAEIDRDRSGIFWG